MIITGFVSIPHITVTVGHFKEVRKLRNAESLIYQTPFNIDLVSSVSFTSKITLNRES